MDWDRIADALRLPDRERLGDVGKVLTRAALVVAVAYCAASSLSAYLMSGMLGKTMHAFDTMAKREAKATPLNLAVNENYRDIVKSIKERNIFNSTGEFPEEKNPERGDDKPKSAFDINGPCVKPSMNVELLGTLYVEGGDSVATLQEQGYSESDIYREGDMVIGQDEAAIVRIERNRVVFNHKGVKECLELASAVKQKKEGGDFPNSNPTAPPNGGTVTTAGGEGGEAASTNCAFDEKYVQEELGPGFGTIIQKARLVPNTTDNVMNGFKIFAIDTSSLLGKTGLQNGDIITAVNDTSLKQPEQGFTVYQAFQDEREVRIQILRRGTTPMTITCRIK